MQTKPFARKYLKVFIIALLLVLICVSCLPNAAPVATPIQTVIVLEQVITKVVTQIVYVPVTVTPTPTPYITDTPTPTGTDTPAAVTASPVPTATPQPPTVTVLVRTQCLYGPDPVYTSKYDILANSPQVAIGRNMDTSWLLVQGSDHANPCWVKAALVKVNTGSYTDPPVVNPVLTPYTATYPAPVVSTTRAGNVVTIFWQPVSMTEADYNGYLVEAWVCQSGQMVFVPKSYVPLYDKNVAAIQNKSVMAIMVNDEPGCSEPSSASIYSSTTTAYSSPKTIPWPAAPAVAATETPTP
jgi:hypothetical protein